MTAYFRQESCVNKQKAARVLMLQGVHGCVKRLGLEKEVKQRFARSACKDHPNVSLNVIG